MGPFSQGEVLLLIQDSLLVLLEHTPPHAQTHPQRKRKQQDGERFSLGIWPPSHTQMHRHTHVTDIHNDADTYALHKDRDSHLQTCVCNEHTYVRAHTHSDTLSLDRFYGPAG